MNLFARTDTKLFFLLFNVTAKRNCRFIKLISKSGDGHVYLLIGLSLWTFDPLDGALFLYTALLAYAFELPLYWLLKSAFKRQRPCDMLRDFRSHIRPSDKFSLPSGHTMAAFLMATLLSHFYPSIEIWAYCWASMIGLSRVLLGVHYPSDILAGGLLGLLVAMITLQFML